ncbi:GGDEF domain-containing phosphodiesterase [Parvularcula lutaonensis]|uniref:EAL domain-containing protein n=1 Tax=Parvularcula lutaonensis TaxID=491923 RepID=A0ABV7MB21_9PROT|nr:GGDEF domain-containing phosphodiesterase [Parvularcula lutaonensis]GGY36296.1 GGDEF-domain containing protein [Parvularcula lutaonensis]
MSSEKSLFAVGPDTVRFALEAAGQAMFEFDPDTGAVAWADPRQAGELLGMEGPASDTCYERLIGSVSPEQAAAREAEVLAAREARRSYCVEFCAGTGSEQRWYEERGTWMRLGGRERMVGVIRRIDAQKKREAQLSYLAAHDEMTGQLNRGRTKEALQRAIDNSVDSSFFLVAIDNVGGINVSFGFDAADQVISTIAERLCEGVGEGCTVGRVAGTKFGIIAPGRSPEEMRERAISILNLVRSDIIKTRSGSIAASVCLGVAPLTAEMGSADIALARAEAALDQARQAGPSSWSVFSEMTDPVSMRHRDTEMSDTILTALNDRRVTVAFQPIVTDVDAPWNKYECLIRLDSTDGEEISAPNFIASAERLGLVHLLDRRVLELATTALAREPDIELAVNVSWETVKDPVWADGYVGHLRANAHVADRLTVELTETRIVDAIEASEEFVARIKALGAKFALDDFGAGYTSFRNLKALDIDILKIDGSFITGLAQSKENQLFVRTLIDLARNFSMKTVAEWVDNENDARILKALGVDYLQGFFISKPVRRPDWIMRERRDDQPALRSQSEAS